MREHAAHDALARLQSVGIDSLVDDRIKPRAVPNGRNRRLKARLNEPDPGILRLEDWPHNTAIHIWKIYERCQQPDVVKSLLLHHVRIRQNDRRYPDNVRLIREVWQADLEAALNDVVPAKVLDNKRKKRADSPLSGQTDEEEDDPPIKKQQHLPDHRPSQNKSPIALESFQPPYTSNMQAKLPSRSSDITVVRRSEGKTMEPALAHQPANDQNHHEPHFEVDGKAGKGNKRQETMSQGKDGARDETECQVGVSSQQPRIPPGFDLVKILDHPNTNGVLMMMLHADVARLEKINRQIGPKQEDDASEASSFASHLVAAALVGEASRALEGEVGQEFTELLKLRMQDERSHLSHQRAVLEKSILKLRAYIEKNPELKLGDDIKKRIDKVLS
ncbi:hypothetical protein HDK77DRAFT_504549 [Phyllosticta capitalensis]